MFSPAAVGVEGDVVEWARGEERAAVEAGPGLVGVALEDGVARVGEVDDR